jgi:hypothetical protein
MNKEARARKRRAKEKAGGQVPSKNREKAAFLFKTL